MLRTFLSGVALALVSATPVLAQHALALRVVDADTRDPLVGATVRLERTPFGAAASADGVAHFASVPAGPYEASVTFVGYAPARVDVVVPAADTLVVALQPDEVDLDEATVSATRSGRTIADTPTRVEVVGEDEIGEKMAMDPSGITMLLTESPGVVVQPTSPVSGGAEFRLQGLDGRYTQLLRDGVPLYGGLDGGLALLQIPPLDLAQVEIVKGPSSTLYGAGAVGGLINLVSRRPGATPARRVLVNATTTGGLDAVAFGSGERGRLGYTVLASAHTQRAFDADGDAFTNLPSARRLTLSPALFASGAGALVVRAAVMAETRDGGDVAAVDGGSGFAERHAAERLTASATYERPLGDALRATVRASASRLRRAVAVPGFRFAGRQWTTASEATLAARRGTHETVGGVDLRTDAFRPSSAGAALLETATSSAGMFAQHTWDVAPALAVEGGLRVDAHSAVGVRVLPRAAVRVQPGGGWSLRASGGAGYAAPTAFVEAAETRAYRGVVPPSDSLGAERAVGVQADVAWRGAVGPLVVTLHQAVYRTEVRNALVPVETPDALGFAVASSPTVGQGAETMARLVTGDVALFLGYVWLDATRGGETLPLAARHRTYSVLVWEAHGRGRVGLEAYYTGSQRLPDGTGVPGYVVAGVMAERRIGPARVFVNVENALDARQSRTAPLVAGARDAPVFAPLWGPSVGIAVNGGVLVEW